MSKNYYELLGVDKNVKDDELKKAYRQKAMEFHPDRNPGNKEAEEKFKEVAEAYDCLSNPQKRQNYDQTGSANGKNFQNMDDVFANFQDLFDSHQGFGGFGGFGNRFRRGAATNERHFKGGNLRLKLDIKLEDSINGSKKTIKLNRNVFCDVCGGSGAKENGKVTCQTCKGHGMVQTLRTTFLGQQMVTQMCPHCRGRKYIIQDACDNCKGKGVILKEEIIDIDLPSGAWAGMEYVMQGFGNAPEYCEKNEGSYGDIIIYINSIDQQGFEKNGNNLVYNYEIDVLEAILGSHIEIKLLDKIFKFEIPSGTNHGKILRLKNQGLTNAFSGEKGDLLVIILLKVPTRSELTPEQIKGLEKIKKQRNEKS